METPLLSFRKSCVSTKGVGRLVIARNEAASDKFLLKSDKVMSPRCGKLIYFIKGDGAVSHWAAKDATLSLQGHRSERRAAWDTIKAASGQQLTDCFSC